MKVLNIALPPLDMRRPWCWPRAYQLVGFVLSGVLGVLLLIPWWRHSWQAWADANDAQDQLMAQQTATQERRTHTAQLLQIQNQPPARFADVSVLTQLAQQQGLQLSHISWDKPQHSPAMEALQLQQLPVHLNVQGAWESWVHWLSQWPSAAPGVTLASLELKADPSGGISAHVVAVAPQHTASETAFELSHVNLEGAPITDPFNTQAWTHAQRSHAAQHPSYERLVAPEFLRQRDWLETFPRERLQYVGHMTSQGEVEALVKVLPPSGAQKGSAMMSVHRVRVGSHLGHDFGKVLAVQADQLLVQELALMPTGEWQTREVRLPLQEAAP